MRQQSQKSQNSHPELVYNFFPYKVAFSSCSYLQVVKYQEPNKCGGDEGREECEVRSMKSIITNCRRYSSLLNQFFLLIC